MKNLNHLSVLVLIVFLISACASPKKALNRGDYDEAVSLSVKKLKKNPKKVKYIPILKEAYRLGNQVDLDRINFLKKTGEPNVWAEVLENYNKLKRRQDKVRILPSSVLSKINYHHVDYVDEIVSAKRKAAEYYYAHGVALLKKGTKYAAREAYADFRMVSTYYKDYKDVKELEDEAYYKGVNFVLFQIKNNSNAVIPKGFENDLKKISTNNLDATWVKYHTKPNPNLDYDYYVFMNLESIYVSPEDVSAKDYVEEKEVEDGWQYVLDSDGNVMKDSTGVDIKVPKYVKIAAYVTEVEMFKKAVVKARVDYIDAYSGSRIKSDKLFSESVFAHRYADVKGERAAMSVKTKKLAEVPILPFPDDLDMIYQTTDDLKSKVKGILRRNKRLLEK